MFLAIVLNIRSLFGFKSKCVARVGHVRFISFLPLLKLKLFHQEIDKKQRFIEAELVKTSRIRKIVQETHRTNSKEQRVYHDI